MSVNLSVNQAVINFSIDYCQAEFDDSQVFVRYITVLYSQEK